MNYEGKDLSVRKIGSKDDASQAVEPFNTSQYCNKAIDMS